MIVGFLAAAVAASAAVSDTSAASAQRSVSVTVPAHIKIMTAYGYDAPVQAGWSTFGKSFNLSALVEGHRAHGLPGMWRIDCIGCQNVAKPGFASGVICEVKQANGTKFKRMCSKVEGDSTDWDDQTRHLLVMAKPHLISGVLTGISLGDEITGHGPGGRSDIAAMFADFEAWVDLVRGLLDEIAPARLATGNAPPHLYLLRTVNMHYSPRVTPNFGSIYDMFVDRRRYYTEADVVALWPHIPQNLTLFSMDDYHPAWMYASQHACAKGGFPRPAGCENETAGLWVYPRYNAAVFPKLGPDTKLLVVPPVYGSRTPCKAKPSVWCTPQTYEQWMELNRGNFTFVRYFRSSPAVSDPHGSPVPLLPCLVCV